jgi:cysteinyl-tRNA synthetase
MSIPTGSTAGEPSAGANTYTETPPVVGDGELLKDWALHWALQRKIAKSARNYTEADRIRAFLRGAGWEVRDGKDGSIDVIRVGRN